MPLTLNAARRGADRTRESVLRWANALPAAQYAVTAVPSDPAGGASAHRRCWSIDELGHAIPWLRRLNTGGFHIVGRPVDPRHVLVDDLHPDALTALTRRHRPAAVVSSSPGSLQAWVTVSDEPLEAALADATAKLLAARYGGDLCAARASQAGRIPGFTNRKPKHRSNTGLFPYALLARSDGPVLDPAGSDLLLEAAALMAKVPPQASPSHLAGPAPALNRSPAEEHAAGVARVLATLPPGSALDRSRADYAVARRLASRGLSVAQIVTVLLAGDRAGDLPPSLAEAYARRTAEAASSEGRAAPWKRGD